MAWNFEKGCEEDDAYNVLGRGPFTPKRNKSFDVSQARSQIQDWERAESDLKRRFFTDEAKVIRKWEAAEMAVVGWDQKSKVEAFRRGYIEWLAGTSKVADEVALSELEIDALPMLERVVAKGYRELAKTEHPDVGGDAVRFDKLRQAKLHLDQMLAEVGDLLKG